jgi:hypothetical protein
MLLLCFPIQDFAIVTWLGGGYKKGPVPHFSGNFLYDFYCRIKLVFLLNNASLVIKLSKFGPSRSDTLIDLY